MAIAEHLVLRAFVVAPVQARGAAAAREPRLQHDAAPGAELAVRRRDHLAGHIRAGDMWERNPDPFHPAALPQIEMVQRARPDPYDHPARTRGWIGRVFELQDLRAAMLVKTDAAHLSGS